MRMSDWSSDVCSSDLSRPHSSGLQLEADALFDAAFEFSGCDAVEALGEVDLAVQGVEAVQVCGVLSFPGAPGQHVWCELGELRLAVGGGRFVPGDVGLEPGDALIGVAALRPEERRGG